MCVECLKKIKLVVKFLNCPGLVISKDTLILDICRHVAKIMKCSGQTTPWRMILCQIHYGFLRHQVFFYNLQSNLRKNAAPDKLWFPGFTGKYALVLFQGELRCMEEKAQYLCRQLLIIKAQLNEARVSRDTTLFIMRTSSSIILDGWQNHPELRHERQKRKDIDCGET